MGLKVTVAQDVLALQVAAEHEDNEWGIEVEPEQRDASRTAAAQELPKGLQYSLPVRIICSSWLQAPASHCDGHSHGHVSTWTLP